MRKLREALSQEIRKNNKPAKEEEQLRKQLTEAFSKGVDARTRGPEYDKASEMIKEKIRHGLSQLMKEEKNKLHQKRKSLEFQMKFKEALKKKILEDERYNQYLQNQQNLVSKSDNDGLTDLDAGDSDDHRQPRSQTKIKAKPVTNAKRQSSDTKKQQDTSKSRQNRSPPISTIKSSVEFSTQLKSKDKKAEQLYQLTSSIEDQMPSGSPLTFKMTDLMSQ